MTIMIFPYRLEPVDIGTFIIINSCDCKKNVFNYIVRIYDQIVISISNGLKWYAHKNKLLIK